jgi:hypothetical protein
LSLRSYFACAVFAGLPACHGGTIDPSPPSDASLDWGGPTLSLAEPCSNVPDYWCDHRWLRDADTDTAIIEHHVGRDLFCYHSIELQSSAPIEIIERNERDERSAWVLDVGGVRLNVRQDTGIDWTDMQTRGWKPGELERVVYPEAAGRSARRMRAGVGLSAKPISCLRTILTDERFASLTRRHTTTRTMWTS